MGLITINDHPKDEEVLNKIFNNEVVVFEDIQGSKIYVNWDGKNFTIKPKSFNADAINILDLALQRYYNKAINYIYSFDDRIKSLMPKKWWFCFEYFPDEQPANIKYDRMPKNNLILTGICKGKKFNYTVDELREFANLFSTDYLPIIFKGKLNQDQIEAIKYFLNTSENDLDFVFGEKNFAFFFYKLLNPSMQNSFLMYDDFQDNVEKLIIRCDDSDNSFELLNPLYNRISEANNTEFVEVYTLILLKFLEYMQLTDIEAIKLKGKKRDFIYINLMSNLFNMFMSDAKEDLMEFEFTIPKFFNKDKFKINTELITNKLTKELIEEDPKIEYIFKVILGSFNRKRKKPIGVFTTKTVELFNGFVEEINSMIDKRLNKLHELELKKSGLVDFDQYYDIKYDVDSEGQVYPDIYDEFESPVDKKGKGKDKGKKEFDTDFNKDDELEGFGDADDIL